MPSDEIILPTTKEGREALFRECRRWLPFSLLGWYFFQFHFQAPWLLERICGILLAEWFLVSSVCFAAGLVWSLWAPSWLRTTVIHLRRHLALLAVTILLTLTGLLLYFGL